MKHRILPLMILVALLTHCEEKPVDDFYGFSSEEKNILIAGLLNNQSFRATTYGTYIESSQNLEYKKCSQGQNYNNKTENCDPLAANTATLGVERLSYCNALSNLCNTISFPFTLKDPGTSTTSEAYNSCQNDRTGGYSDWRVAGISELLKLTTGGRTTMLLLFSETPEEKYWSATANEADPSGATARTVSFARDDFGMLLDVAKDTRLAVRCVRNR